MTKKSSHEKFPSTAKYSDRSRADDASHTVSLDTEFRCIGNPDEVVAPEDRVKAYKVQLQVAVTLVLNRKEGRGKYAILVQLARPEHQNLT